MAPGIVYVATQQPEDPSAVIARVFGKEGVVGLVGHQRSTATFAAEPLQTPETLSWCTVDDTSKVLKQVSAASGEKAIVRIYEKFGCVLICSSI
jgi:hypothetical protein